MGGGKGTPRSSVTAVSGPTLAPVADTPFVSDSELDARRELKLVVAAFLASGAHALRAPRRPPLVKGVTITRDASSGAQLGGGYRGGGTAEWWTNFVRSGGCVAPDGCKCEICTLIIVLARAGRFCGSTRSTFMHERTGRSSLR